MLLPVSKGLVNHCTELARVSIKKILSSMFEVELCLPKSALIRVVERLTELAKSIRKGASEENLVREITQTCGLRTLVTARSGGKLMALLNARCEERAIFVCDQSGCTVLGLA